MKIGSVTIASRVIQDYYYSVCACVCLCVRSREAWPYGGLQSWECGNVYACKQVYFESALSQFHSCDIALYKCMLYCIVKGKPPLLD